MRVIVVGGGVIGVSCAYYLARRGVDVTLLERDVIAGRASAGNAGCIAPGHGPINRPVKLAEAARWLTSDVSPIYVPPRPDPKLIAWLWAFRRGCTAAHVESCLDLLGPIGQLSRRLYDDLMREERLDCDFNPQGYYDVFATDRAFEGAVEEARGLENRGFSRRAVDGKEMRAIEPALADGVRGGMHHGEAIILNPKRFVEELADRASRRGVAVRTGVSVARVTTEGGKATGVVTSDGERVEGDAVLLATGAYSMKLLHDVGLDLPVRPAKGYHRDFTPGPGSAPPLRVACLLAETMIFCSPIDRFVRFAGTLEFSKVDETMRPRRLEQLSRGSVPYFRQPGVGEPLSEWCGLRPCLPDGLPAAGPVPGLDRLFVANGHAMMGLTLGPATGALVAETIATSETPELLEGFTPSRYVRFRSGPSPFR